MDTTTNTQGSALDRLLTAAPELLETLLENMQEGVSLVAEDGTILYTNAAEDRLFGYDNGVLIGRSLSMLNDYHPDENARALARVRAELQLQGSWTGEWLNRRQNGTTFVSRTRIYAVRVGQLSYWLSVRQDVTAERESASVLSETRTRLELATRAAGIGIWDWDLQRNEFELSPRAQAIWQFDKPRVTIEEVRARVHPADEELLRLQAERAFDPEIRDESPYEYRIVMPDGSLRWILAHGEALFREIEGQWQPVRYVGTFQDITARRTLEDESRAAAQTLSLALDAGRMAVWEYDVATDSVEATPKLNRILGFPESARPTLDEYRSGYEPGEEERLQAIGMALLEQGDPFMEAEYRYRWPDGTPRWLLLRCETMFNSQGAPERSVGVVMDITERKQAEALRIESEQRLRELNESLERRVELEVAERAKAEQAWRQAQKMEAVGRLTGGIAHDFNNLLMAVTSSLELIRRRSDQPERVMAWAEAGLEASERGRQLTRQLLAFSRVQKPELRPVDVAELLNGMQGLLQRTLGPLVRLGIETRLPSAIINTDPTQFELAVMNLVINARDAMPQGGHVNVSLSAARPEQMPLQTGQCFAVQVTDTGSGMAQDVMDRAFDPFFSTKAVGKGTGLGLSQVQTVAIQAGGTVQIDSAIGAGTCVTMILPRSSQAVQREPSREELTGVLPTDLAILLVDDDADVRRSVGDTLSELGCQVVEAADGEQGLAALDELLPDILLLDYAMPGCTGAEVARRARQRFPGLPILFLTGYSDTAAIEAAVGLHAPILRKPFRMAELQAALANALAQGKVQG